MHKSFLLIFLLVVLGSHAQFTITGKVLSADNQQPIASISVFLSNTSKGAVTDSKGEFVISNVPDGRYDLVVSSLGYATLVQQVNTQQLKEPLVLLLKTKPNDLGEVVVGGYIKETWAKWGKFFIDNFIGQTPYAADCSIANTNTIQFKLYKKENVLRVIANEPLVITNKALGYTIKYDLELFEYSFKNKILFYQGYPLFEELKTNRRGLARRWAENRKKVYYGSIMQFMRSLFRNKLTEDGFEIRKCVKEPNLEKQRVKRLYASGIMRKSSSNINIVIGDHGDSSAYYNRIMSEPDETERVFPDIIPADSVAYAVNKTTAGLEFKNYLHITYKIAKEDPSYLTFFGLNRAPMAPTSLITLPNGNGIEIIANGLYYSPLDMLSTGYWSWSEKMATMLPFDYWP